MSSLFVFVSVFDSLCMFLLNSPYFSYALKRKTINSDLPFFRFWINLFYCFYCFYFFRTRYAWSKRRYLCMLYFHIIFRMLFSLLFYIFNQFDFLIFNCSIPIKCRLFSVELIHIFNVGVFVFFFLLLFGFCASLNVGEQLKWHIR